MPHDRLLDVHDVAEYLGVSVNWVYDHSTGKALPELPSFKLGKYRRYRLADLDVFLESQRADALDHVASRRSGRRGAR